VRCYLCNVCFRECPHQDNTFWSLIGVTDDCHWAALSWRHRANHYVLLPGLPIGRQDIRRK